MNSLTVNSSKVLIFDLDQRLAMTKRLESRATSSSLISADTIPRVLSGIEFPNSKDNLKEYAMHHLRKYEIEYADEVLDILERIPSRGYSNMPDIEHEVDKIK
jgi:Protein of unknown function (DUF2795)